MTAKQAAQHILAGILKLAESKKDEALSMRRAGDHDDAAVSEIEAGALFNMAAGLSSAIDDGEYGE